MILVEMREITLLLKLNNIFHYNKLMRRLYKGLQSFLHNILNRNEPAVQTYLQASRYSDSCTP